MPLADQTLRRLIPAVPALSRVRVLMWPLDVFDRLVCLPYREFRGLPPNRLRIRVGVGNRILFNAAQFRMFPVAFWFDAVERGLVRFDSNIVDLGCGCGRFAHTLRDVCFHDRGFTGRYLGVDVDDEMLAWCRGHFPSDRFVFHKVDTYSRTYNPRASGPAVNGAASGSAGFTLPMEDGSSDFVFANSLFSHLLEGEFTAYLRESARVLRVGGHMQFSVFCMEHADQRPGSRWSFRHRAGAAYIENETYPEAAVAYELAWLRGACLSAGFSQVTELPSAGQTMMGCRK